MTDAQRTDIATSLEAMPQVEEVFYETQEEAYEHFQRAVPRPARPGRERHADALPESFRVKLNDPTQFEVVAEALQGRPGSGRSRTTATARRPLRVLKGLRDAALVIAVVQLVAATLLIGNTIRVAAFSRRRETGIMRLVGASKLYIQLPFLLEGMLAGLVGAGLGLGLIFAGKMLVLDRTLRPLFRSGVIPSVTTDDILAISPYLLAIGVGISGLASLVTLRRYIKV